MNDNAERNGTCARVQQKVDKGGKSSPVSSCGRLEKSIPLVSRELYKIKARICPANSYNATQVLNSC